MLIETRGKYGTTEYATAYPDDWTSQEPPSFEFKPDAIRLWEDMEHRDKVARQQRIEAIPLDFGPVDDRPEPIEPNEPPNPPDCETYGEDQYVLSLWHTWQEQGREIVRDLQYVDAQDVRQETAVNIWQRSVNAISQDRKPRASQRHVLTVLRREANKIIRQREDIAHADETIAADARERLIELKMRAQQDEHTREVQRALLEVNSQKPPAPVMTLILD